MIILFRRLPVVLLLQRYIPELETFQEAIFCGWFGPIGAGAIFYAALCIEQLDIPEEPLFSIVSIVVLASLLLHGGSVGLFHVGFMVRERTRERARTRTQSPQRRQIEGPGIDMANGNFNDTELEDVVVDSFESIIDGRIPA